MRKFFFGLAFLSVGLIFYLPRPRTRICKLSSRVTISTVTRGIFSETIPQTGTLDTTEAGKLNIKVEIDELYVKRISVGLKAVSTINNLDVPLVITKVDTAITNGRFFVNMTFTDSVPEIPNDYIRLRIELSNSREAHLLPLGGFYKDTDGKWVFVLDSASHAIRRDIVLGARNPEHFEVLSGLDPGDRVITSTYEGFLDRTSVELSQIQGSKEVVYIK